MWNGVFCLFFNVNIKNSELIVKKIFTNLNVRCEAFPYIWQKSAMYNDTPQERLFQNAKPLAHYCSPALQDALLYENEKEMGIIINFIAIALMFAPNCRLLAFAVMSNHLHFILEGEPEWCEAFIGKLVELLDNYFRYNGKSELCGRIRFTPTVITSLKQLKDAIVYVIRNPFVVRTDVNVFACPSTSGHLYFNPMMRKEGIYASDLKGRALRDFLHTRKGIALTDRFRVLNGFAQPWSFVDYERAMSFFSNAREFVTWTLKNVEGQIEIALKLGETPSLSDQELLSVAFKLCKQRFANIPPSKLEEKDKMKLALMLKNEYYASNGQISRTIGLSPRVVDSMFPLAVKQ